MRKNVVNGMLGLFVVAAGLLTGCSHAVTSGNNRVTIGTIEVRKSLELIGNSVKDTIDVDADENGNVILSAGKGSMEQISFYLPPTAQEEAIGYWNKSIEWGATAKREKVEMQKYIGNVSSGGGAFSGTTLMNLTFISGKDGEAWNNHFAFCYIMPALARSTGAGIRTNPCDKEVSLYVSQSSTEQLIAHVKNVGTFQEKAKKSQSKSDLFK